MPPIDPLQAREFALEVVRQLRAAGHEALWAGGCVRDRLLGKQPKDYDVATSATPDQVRELFGRRKTIAIGAAFGVISVLGPAGAGMVEVATFRRDAAYSDGRHPDGVTFSTAEEDAQRRDFTINGLFFDPLAEQVIDYVGGLADLKRGIVRAIRDPHERFAEDKLRMLRAVRFAITFDFELEADTLAAIGEHAAEITVVSAERIAAELRRMLVHPRRAKALELLHRSGLLVAIWPEAAAIASIESRAEAGANTHALASVATPDALASVATAWHRALRVLECLIESGFAVAVAAVLRETPEGTASCESRAALVERVFHRWRLTNEERQIIAWVLAHEAEIRQAPAQPWPRLQRILISEHVVPLLQLAEAVAVATGSEPSGVEFCRERLAWPREQLDPPQLISGNDLKRAGIKPGPRYKELLDAVRDAQLEHRINTCDEALSLVRKLLAEQG